MTQAENDGRGAGALRSSTGEQHVLSRGLPNELVRHNPSCCPAMPSTAGIRAARGIDSQIGRYSRVGASGFVFTAVCEHMYLVPGF
ncbi:hypothetical protein PYCCODRAFT_1438089 [Trametes coccinea BRFM310]|uniref:Uncharacterized protein n=1 Tax=Trametes coccinea (strain BRFM310) TaxID=1353009 RepID=A0A1Y2IGI4_TRAC3|nr:hypothetical protein PYCCODRAFT_1441157 [Trametes coccinea BRFM310]OSC99733.1 hypothetical protein PYCCODRAFT_1438089 [Trametes coccinea BRFM310]